MSTLQTRERSPEEIIASARWLLRIFKGSGMLRHEELIRELCDALEDATQRATFLE